MNNLNFRKRITEITEIVDFFHRVFVHHTKFGHVRRWLNMASSIRVAALLAKPSAINSTMLLMSKRSLTQVTIVFSMA